MYDVTNIALVVAVFFGATISPGPATFATATVALSVGRARATIFALGLTIGHTLWGCLVVGGLMAQSDRLANIDIILSLGGGLYFIWLSFRSLQSVVRPQHHQNGATIGQYLLWKGVALNLLNPTIILIWMSVMALGPAQYQEAEPLAVILMLCIVAAFVSYFIVAYAFSFASAMATYRRLSRWVDGCAAAVYAAASFGLLSSTL